MTSGKALFTMTALAGLAVAAASGLAISSSGDTMTRATSAKQFGELTLPVSAVFAPDTTPRQMVEGYKRILEVYGFGYEHMIGGAGLELQPTAFRWPSPVNTPVNLEYSFVPDGVQTGMGPNSIHATLTSSIGPEVTWKARFAEALNEWAAVTGCTYTEVSDDGAPWSNSSGSATRGDIRIVAGPLDGGSGTLAFNSFPTNGDMFLDQAENWGAGATDLFFRQVITHENGHGMGLAHSCPQQSNKIMEPFINTNFTGPQRDDRLAIQYMYGDMFEPNNTIGSAEDLDALGLQSDVQLQLSNLSLRDTADGDLFKFEAPSGSVINLAQAAPQGVTYLAGAQNGNGTCQPGVAFDSLRQLDVVIDVLNSVGAVITTMNSAGLGVQEDITNFALTQGGTYYLRVRSTGAGQSSTPIQEYRLRFNVTLQSVSGDLNGDGVVNGTDLAILLSVWGTDGLGTGADLNGDGVVNGSDLATLLSSWT